MRKTLIATAAFVAAASGEVQQHWSSCFKNYNIETQGKLCCTDITEIVQNCVQNGCPTANSTAYTAWLGEYCWNNGGNSGASSNTWTATAKTDTVYWTTVDTITSCATTVTDCPSRPEISTELSKVTHVVARTTTRCPYVTATPYGGTRSTISCPGSPHCPATKTKMGDANSAYTTMTCPGSPHCPSHMTSNDKSPLVYTTMTCPGSPHCPAMESVTGKAPPVYTTMTCPGSPHCPSYLTFNKNSPPVYTTMTCPGSPHCPTMEAMAEETSPVYTTMTCPGSPDCPSYLTSEKNSPPVYITMTCPGSPDCPSEIATGRPNSPSAYTHGTVTCPGSPDCPSIPTSAMAAWYTYNAVSYAGGENRTTAAAASSGVSLSTGNVAVQSGNSAANVKAGGVFALLGAAALGLGV